MNIGEKIRRIRLENGLTQEDLANRSELTKGYISQIERDLSSPSIATLGDILEALGTNISTFFNETAAEKIVFRPEDWFEKVEDNTCIEWIIPNAQKNEMEPIILTLHPHAVYTDDPHHGEEFGYVLTGKIELTLGTRKFVVHEGETFYFKADNDHAIFNPSDAQHCKILWVSTPPTF